MLSPIKSKLPCDYTRFFNESNNKKNRRGGFGFIYFWPFRVFNIFMMISRWESVGSFQYKFINCNDSFLANGSNAVWSDTHDFGGRPLRGSRSIKPGRPEKKNDTGVSNAALSSNRRDAAMRLPALSYF